MELLGDSELSERGSRLGMLGRESEEVGLAWKSDRRRRKDGRRKLKRVFRRGGGSCVESIVSGSVSMVGDMRKGEGGGDMVSSVSEKGRPGGGPSGIGRYWRGSKFWRVVSKCVCICRSKELGPEMIMDVGGEK